MKKSKIHALPLRKLVLRREAIAQLTRAQLGHVEGANFEDGGNGCSLRPASCNHSNVERAAVNSCVIQ